ncbi:MAG: hypothetical protein ABI680_05755 [Chthoniobacteraceae bacterium]
MLDKFKWIAVITAGVLVAGCTKTEDTTDTDEEDDETIVETAPEPPAEVVVVAEATPPPKRLAPKGIFYLITKKSIETDAGIVGFRPGTPVQLQPDGKYLVEGRTMELLPHEITNDLDVAAQYAGAHAQAQAALRQRLFTAPPTPAPSTSSSKKKTASTQPRVQAPASTFQSNSSLNNQSHTRVNDGWLWQRDDRGNWSKVRRVR